MKKEKVIILKWPEIGYGKCSAKSSNNYNP
jgi:hypothetical protein